ncbi:testis-specific H1 histone [Myotis daubentonii]|uniref:testis-specific H1 histone n=1 Tax=Myotis daubentonii TaxID=98922 RepID=UPI002873A620|nr:testis-specific H1 histone [Myotis daubentonii]
MAEATGAVAEAAVAGAVAVDGAGAGAGAEAEAEKAEPSGGSQGAEVKTPQPTEKILAAPPRRDSSSVLQVSQLLLGAIVSHAGLTVATLRKELGNAGYQVRRKCQRRPGSARKPGIRSTLIRVSGSHTGYLRVWKPPKPKRKPGRPRSEEGVRSWRTPSGLRSPRRRRRVRCRKAARRAREVWRRNARVNSTLRRLRPRVRGQVRSRAKEGTRAKVMDRGRGRLVKDKPRSREKRPREEKKQEPGKPGRRAVPRSASVKTGPRAARSGCRSV